MAARRPVALMLPLRVAALGGALLLGFAAGGCVTKSKAQAQARAAYLAGQREAMMQMQQTQLQTQGPSVTIRGEVRNPVVPWTEGMTLRQALVAADYRGATDPAQVIVVHNGIGRQYDPKRLFNGPELPVYPGDTVQLLTRPAPPSR